MLLSPEETRVLGCLVEKQLATPQQYPLTENSVILACNQSTNRDPIVSYDQTTVRRALLSLREKGLARVVHRPGDRVPKHRHLLEEALDLDAPALAVLCVLLLRGPQTPGEIRTRGERLHTFATVEDVAEVIEQLASRPEQLVQRLERQPGQKEVRYTQLLGERGEASVTLGSVEAPLASDAGPTVAELAGAVAELQDEVRALRRDLDAVRGEPGGGPARNAGTGDFGLADEAAG